LKETKSSKRKRAAEVVNQLCQAYPDSGCSLQYRSAHEILIATILSAQCTDQRVNIVTKSLFLKYTSPEDFAYCNVNELSKDIHSCGYHNQKARSIKGSSLKIVEEYDGKMPDNLEDLVKLPGVGRKTANCVLGEIYSIPSMVIDTHMVRIMGLLGFTKAKEPQKIEFEMMDIFKEEHWIKLTHMIIDHGRAICIARRPQCGECILVELCPSSQL